MPSFNLNQTFSNAIKGSLSQGVNFNQKSYQILPTSVNVFYGATAVKLVSDNNPIPRVEKAAATDQIVGFLVYDPILNTPLVGQMVNIAAEGCEMWMESGAAIARGAQLEIVATGDQVITSAGVNKVVGIALDAATAAGTYIRVKILSPLIKQF